MMRIIHHLLEQTKDPKKLANQYIYSNLDLVLPAMSSLSMLSVSDLDSLQDDPLRFVEYTLNHGLVEQLNDVYHMCDSILKLLFKKKPSLSQHFLERLINQPLNRYKSIVSLPNVTQQQYTAALFHKDVAIRTFGGLSRIFDHDNFLNNTVSFLKSLLQEHLSLPPQQWADPQLLECRTLWCFARFSQTLHSLAKRPEHPLHADAVQAALSVASQCLSLLLVTPELKQKIEIVPGLAAARLQASVTLLALLTILQVKENIFPFAAQLFLSLLEMLEENSDAENLNVLFQQLIVTYKDSLFPVAQQVLARLVPKFMTLLQELMTPEDDDDDGDFLGDDDDVQEKYWAAVAQLSSMHTIVGAIGDNADALRMAEQYLIPVCTTILDNELSDYIEEMMTIVQCFTYYEEVISDEVWTLYPKIIRYLLNGNDENYAAVLPSLANFLSKDANIFTRLLSWQPPGSNEIVQIPAVELFYSLIFSHYERPDYTADTWLLQEGSTHLLRTHLGWLPGEDKLPGDQITRLLARFVPCLFSQLGYSLFQTHPATIATLPRDDQGRVVRDPSAPSKQRTKYAILILDCIQTLIHKFPSWMIDQLCVLPAQPDVQPQGHQINCLQFVLDCSATCLRTSDRPQSLYTNIIGLSTLLQWFSRDQCGTADFSHIRNNIISVLLNGIISFRRVEDEENADEDADDDEEGPGFDQDAPNEGEDDELAAEAAVEDDDTIAMRQAERQQAVIEEYALAARQMSESSFDIYYHDNDFVTPLDSINYYKISLDAISKWIEQCPKFQQHVPAEIQLARSFQDPQHESHPIMTELMQYILSSSEIWQKEQEEDDLEYQAEMARLQRTRQEQLAQMPSPQ
jgi:hypothetical protein